MAQHRKFTLSLRAEEDLIGIWGYSFKQWGEKQADKYVSDLYDRFSWLVKNQQSGKLRPDIENGYYCYRQGSHLIFYTIDDAGINIIGLPHKAMDILNYFD